MSVGIALKDEFEGLGVKVLGTQIDTVITTEDRELFASAMAEINEKCARSEACNTVKEAVDAANAIGYPLIVRAAYALGGLGSGFADNEEELVALCNKAFATSPQVLVERSMKGWKKLNMKLFVMPLTIVLLFVIWKISIHWVFTLVIPLLLLLHKPCQMKIITC